MDPRECTRQAAGRGRPYRPGHADRQIPPAEAVDFPIGRDRTDGFDLLSGDEPDLHDDLRGLWLWTVRKIATVSTALRGLFRMAVPADREPYLAALFPLRADGVGLAF